ncbi:N-acetyltransferase [Thalassotalea insulae]|uniref:N-acetyltransferase n=1 Tax=Thalassotalea insulae TaxID=2056778 RepID=A0ABQ6GRH1_9GAMM|nr:GNAT family N-acetyltransferase [Thalassotalea insulae]GLX78543.1 N-acetyltransferase [Thalassotalea insulae]
MKIQKITWQQALPVRHCVLWPTKPLSFCKITSDETADHYGAFINDKLVCVASIYIDGDNARLRKFATLPAFQSRGVGSKVIEHIVSELKKLKISYFWCDARTTALTFYQKFGLDVQGPEFTKSGLPYYKMAVRWH